MKNKYLYMVVSILGCSLVACRSQNPHPLTVEQNSESSKEPKDNQSEKIISLKTYEIPSWAAASIKSVLESLFSVEKNEKIPGKVTLISEHQLVVVAPHEIQSGIKPFIDEIVKRGPTPVPPVIEVTYFLVIGHSSAGLSVEDPELKEIFPVLKTITENQGPMTFQLLERITETSLAGEYSKFIGKQAIISQTASVINDALVAHLSIALGSSTQQINTHIRMKLGQWMVLGQTGFELVPMYKKLYLKEDLLKSLNLQLFYVVKPVIR